MFTRTSVTAYRIQYYMHLICRIKFNFLLKCPFSLSFRLHKLSTNEKLTSRKFWVRFCAYLTNSMLFLVSESFIFIFVIFIYLFFFCRLLLVQKQMMLHYFSSLSCPRQLHLSISNWVSSRVRPRLWDSTFVAIALIWSSVSSSHGSIPSMLWHAWRWYWWRLSISSPSRGFVFLILQALFLAFLLSSRVTVLFKNGLLRWFLHIKL